MKLKKLLVMGAVALGMMACNNKQEVDVPTPNQEGNAYVAFSIAMPSNSARGVEGNDHNTTYVGTDIENKVAKIRVVLYDQSTHHAEYAFDFTPAADHGSGDNAKHPAGTAVYITDAKKVVAKKYDVLVLLNPTDKVLAVTNPSSNLSEFMLPAEEDLANLTSDAGFFMSNAQNLAEVKRDHMKPDAEAAQGAPFKDGANGIKVDRAVSKVFVGGDFKVVPPSSATATIKGWKLDITNKKLFWMRKLGKVVTGLNTFDDEVKGDNTTRYNRYAIDPNVDAKEKSTTDFNYLETTTETDNADLLMQTYDPSVITAWNTTGYADANGEYTMENTMQPWCQYEPVTTRVIIKATFVPDGFTADESWYSFDNVKMTKATFQGYVTKVAADETLPAEAPTGLKEAIKAATDVATGHDFSADETGESYVMTFKATSIKDKKLKFYKNAECFYIVKIRHFDDAQSSQTDYLFTTPDVNNGYGRYGVVRNNIYKLNVMTVSQPGDPVPSTPDPEQPDDTEELWLSVQTEIMPWLVRQQDIHL